MPKHEMGGHRLLPLFRDNMMHKLPLLCFSPLAVLVAFAPFQHRGVGHWRHFGWIAVFVAEDYYWLISLHHLGCYLSLTVHLDKQERVCLRIVRGFIAYLHTYVYWIILNIFCFENFPERYHQRPFESPNETNER